MELSHFSKLYERIQIEPSILLLGQQYLFMNGENDPVWSKLATEIYTDLHLPRRKSSYPDLWERAVTKEADAESVMARIVEASSICRYNSAIDAIMSFGGVCYILRLLTVPMSLLHPEVLRLCHLMSATENLSI